MQESLNHLIELLPRKDRQRLLALCEPVDLALSQVVYQGGEPTRHVYFPIDATISLVTPIDGKPGIEVGMVGREGMAGAHLILGVETTSLHAVVQGGGRALRVAAVPLGREIKRSPALAQCLHRYIHVLMSQFAVSAACLRFHLIQPRLARWLLMTQDRAQDDSFQMTQAFLAYMLGVRRVGITAAAGAFQRAGLIEYRRGTLSVLNRRGLESAACGCYEADRKSYAELLG